MDIFSPIVHFLTDKTRKLSSKAMLLIFIVILLVVLDNTFSFSYYYNTSQKINQLKQITEVLKDETLDRNEKNKVLQLRNNILTHRTLKDVTYDYLTNLNFESNPEQIQTEPTLANKENIRNPNIHFITSGWWLLIAIAILIIVFPFVLLTDRDQIGSMFLGFAVIIGFGYLVALILSKLFSFIPLIYDNPTYNYILNFVLSGLVLLSSKLITTKSKKTIANNG